MGENAGRDGLNTLLVLIGRFKYLGNNCKITRRKRHGNQERIRNRNTKIRRTV
jgi:hypothetical protein